MIQPLMFQKEEVNEGFPATVLGAVCLFFFFFSLDLQ